MLVGIVAIHAATIMILLFEWLSPSGFNMKVNPSDAAQKLLVLLLISLLISYPRFPFQKNTRGTRETRNYPSRQWSLIWTTRVTSPRIEGKEIDREPTLFPRPFLTNNASSSSSSSASSSFLFSIKFRSTRDTLSIKKIFLWRISSGKELKNNNDLATFNFDAIISKATNKLCT